MKNKLFTKDFTLVMIGQIISIFGNQIIRYALPIYLLTQTGSASLYGFVMAISFVPMIVLSPIGGIIADRMNKRNIMVVLDFTTAILSFTYMLIRGHFALVPLIIAVLMLLYAIQGAYQPAVQGSLPLLVSKENLTQANSIVNGISSLANIIGPALGGVFLASFGLNMILAIGTICFLASAIMEIFIHIPYTRIQDNKKPLEILYSDMKESLHFISNEHKEIGKIVSICVLINLLFSSLIMVGFPVIVTKYLGFYGDTALKLQGLSESSLAIGGLAGAMLTGLLAKKLNVRHTPMAITVCAIMLLPIGFILSFSLKGMLGFGILIGASFLMMVSSAIFNIQLITYLQIASPSNMISKLMALVSSLCMCATPLGQLIYGYLFEHLNTNCGILFYLVCAITCFLSYQCKKALKSENLDVSCTLTTC